MLRTSWVFGACGGNFPRTILRLAGERDALRIISDQFGAPTSAHLIADVTAQLIAQWLARPTGGFAYGTYHLTAAGETTWYDLACYVIKRARDRGWSIKVRDEAIKAITTAEYPTAAKRPLNSRLDTSPLRNTFGLSLPPWQQGIDFVMRHWQERP
jgi:dTDP-4-dehydrorhamnose reductase